MSERLRSGARAAQQPVARAAHSSLAPGARAVLALQRAAGNGAVTQLLQRRPKTAAELRQSEGFKQLTDQERRRLEALLKGTTSVSQGATRHLEHWFEAKKYGALDTDPEAFRKYMRDVAYLHYGVGLQRGWRSATKPFSVGGAAIVAGHPFATGSAEATASTVRVCGRRGWHSIKVFDPTTYALPGDLVLPTVEQLARALAALPSESLTLIKQVNLNPKAVPDARQMDADGDGVVNVYPNADNRTVDALARVLMHEAGHVISTRRLGSDMTKGWDPWREAMRKDDFSVSQYAGEGEYEDFAESWSLWLAVRGTRRAAEVKALIPHRVKLMESFLKGS